LHIVGHPIAVLSAAEIELICDSALQILREVGAVVENEVLLARLAETGLPVDPDAQRVTFPSQIVERFIAEADKCDWKALVPQARGAAGVYYGLYLDPVSGEIGPWSEEALLDYFDLAHHLPNVGSVGMFGTRVAVPGILEPLYERYYCWKYGAGEAGTIYSHVLCPYLLELYQALADDGGRDLADVFRGVLYLQSPLKLGHEEAAQVAWFRERGVRVQIGDMWAMGSSAPVTVAGAVTLNLAEQLALGIMNWAWFGVKRLVVGCSMSALDARTLIFPFGRPEMAIANVVSAQLARHLGAHFGGHAGLADAKRPSTEAGAQKALTAIPTLMVGGSVTIDCGGLSSGDLCSPVQMVLDAEFVGALRRFTVDDPIDEDAIGLETIIEAGPGGQFVDKLHTARYLRGRGPYWEPSVWSRELLRPWLQGAGDTDVDRARDVVMAARRPGERPRKMSESLERAVTGIIAQAGRDLL
jgi:trimethylamine--corrinoid protein Co-methyltransferase